MEAKNEGEKENKNAKEPRDTSSFGKDRQTNLWQTTVQPFRAGLILTIKAFLVVKITYSTIFSLQSGVTGKN